MILIEVINMGKISLTSIILNKICGLYDCVGEERLVEQISGGEGRYSFIIESEGRNFF